ncbi:hypothetical protein BGW80DRAFT_582691 [Lactifluus volemus]|nr:hypothetical protein BGW80DRAFT_582691 [Lactifluus volemus]
MGASQLPRSARRRWVHLILVGLLDRLVQRYTRLTRRSVMRSPCSTRYSRCACSSRSVGPRYVWWRGLAKQDPSKAQPFKPTRLSMGLSEDTFLEVNPDQPIELFVTNLPQGPSLAVLWVIRIYNAPIGMPPSRSRKSIQYIDTTTITTYAYRCRCPVTFSKEYPVATSVVIIICFFFFFGYR